MARSKYIYVIISDEAPVAAFTVKHELVSWVKKMKEHLFGPFVPSNEATKIFRVSDGDCQTEDITEEIVDLL